MVPTFRCPSLSSFRIAALVALLAMPLPAAAEIIIDSFSTNQAALSLTFPPSGTSASSSVSGAGIVGGERDLQIALTAGVIAGNSMSAVVSSGFYSYSQDATISGSGTIQWDGTDGSAAVDPTGLGGIDLTAGGTQDAILIRTFFDDLPISFVVEVFTDAGNASSVTVVLPGLIFSATSFVIPYSSFATTLGAGADFTDVGAITLTGGSSVTAPDVVLDFVQTAALVSATKTVALVDDVNSNGLADPGDTLRYSVIITNPDDAVDAAATGVAYTSGAPANTALVVGMVTTTQGTVTIGNGGGDTSVAVDVGTIADGASATITFDVQIDNPVAAGVTEISCQGTVTTDTLPGGVLTDDPAPPGMADPTVEPVSAAPVVTATKTAALLVDTNGDGQAGPGDTLEYTAVITNAGNEDASGVVFTSGAPTHTNLVNGSVTTTAGTVTTGNGGGDTSVAVSVGTVPGAGGTVTITFQVTIDNPLPGGVTQISCQGTVTGTNFPSIPTDDPATVAEGDATLTPIAQASVVEVPTLNAWGLGALLLTLLGLGMWRVRRATA